MDSANDRAYVSNVKHSKPATTFRLLSDLEAYMSECQEIPDDEVEILDNVLVLRSPCLTLMM